MPGNDYLVSLQGGKVVLLNPPSPGQHLTYEQALYLAAWLVAIAEPFSGLDFDTLLKKIQNG